MLFDCYLMSYLIVQHFDQLLFLNVQLDWIWIYFNSFIFKQITGMK